jgi:iron complex transport system ATP-binding protein
VSDLRFDDVWAGYGGDPVVRGVSLRVPAGEVVGLVGPNGSGKTTLVRAASRALRPTSGRVLVDGVDPYSISARRAARMVAVVPQDVVPAFSFTALEVAMMGRSPHRSAWHPGGPEDWAQVRDAMEATGVSELADRPIEELSGGERRRVVLAQSLAQDTPVLLLDEPTTHLDLLHVVELVTVVRSLADDGGRAILAVFHDLNIAAATCDRLYVLSQGRVVTTGPPHEVLTRELLADVYGVDADVVEEPRSGRPMVALRTQGPAPVTPYTGGPAPRPRPARVRAPDG